MASIVQRGKKHCVVYSMDFGDGKPRQKWETFDTAAEAKRRKTEIEYHQSIGNLAIPKCTTLNDLLKEYVSLYGKSVWSMSVYSCNVALIRNYISPMLGDMKLNEITARVLEKYYATLPTVEAVQSCAQKYRKYKAKTFVALPTIRKIHNLLRSAFTQAMKWDLMERNPATLATVPKFEMKKRDIWDAPTLFRAIELCEDERLKLCMNLSFACSMRLGEMLGLTWDCVDISEESVRDDKASIFINKELQRANKAAFVALEKKDVVATFPEAKVNCRTVLLLKKPKTVSSVRKVFLPKTVAEMLAVWKDEQDSVREALGAEYQDYSLVIASPLGTPVEGSRIEAAMRRLIQENNLPPVVFHSLRHTSITYKLKLNGGDIKAVQGDSGHAQAKMVTDQYSHILDESRVENAHLLEEAFYGGQGIDVKERKRAKKEPEVAEQVTDAGIDPALLIKILGNPDMVKLLKSLTSAL